MSCYKFPKPYPLTKQLKDILEPQVDEKYIVPQQVMEGYKNKSSIFKKRFLVKELDEVAYCLVAKSGRAVITNNYIYNDLEQYKNKPCANNDLDYLTDNQIPIRALTPLEYWRLMGVSDEDFNKVKDAGISDTQLYKLAGNSIVVNVLVEIFGELFKGETK